MVFENAQIALSLSYREARRAIAAVAKAWKWRVATPSVRAFIPQLCRRLPPNTSDQTADPNTVPGARFLEVVCAYNGAPHVSLPGIYPRANR